MREGLPPGDVSEPVTAVTVAGVRVDAVAWSVSRALSAPGAGGLVAAGGRLTLSALPDGVDVSERVRSSWRHTAPGLRDRVGVWAGTDGQSHRLLVGLVDGVSGAATSDVLDVDLVDDILRLNVPTSIVGLLRAMPPHADGGAYRNVGLQAEYVVDRALRAARFYVTPGWGPGCVLHAPLQSSMWPHLGTCTASGVHTTDPSGFVQPTFRPTPEGVLGAQNALADYLPAASVSASAAVDVSFVVGSTHAATASVTVQYTSGYVRLVATAGVVRAETASGVVASLAVAPGEYRVVSLVRRGSAVSLRTDAGHTTTGTAGVPTGTVSSVRVSAPSGSRLAGVQVCVPPTPADDHAVLSSQQTARLHTHNLALYLDATPDIAGRRVLDLLAEIARAQCAQMWIDEDGVFRWAHTDWLHSRPSVATLTAADDLLDAAWSTSTDSAAVNITVKGVAVALSQSRWPNVTLWQGTAGTLDDGQVIEEWITARDETWAGVDDGFEAPFAANDGTLTANARRGRGSLTGGVVTEDGQPDVLVGGGYAGAAALSGVAPGTWKLTISAGSMTPTQSLVLKIPDAPAVAAPFRDTPLPVLRGKARAQFTDVTHEPAANTAGRDAHTHDGGMWVQDGVAVNGLQRLGDWLAGYYGRDRVRVTCEVVPDLRVQLGDMVTITDPVVFGVSLTGLVISTDTAGTTDGLTLRLGVDVLTVTTPGATLAEYDTRWAGHPLADRDARWQGATLADFDADPLG